jgi:hypothetical protein
LDQKWDCRRPNFPHCLGCLIRRAEIEFAMLGQFGEPKPQGLALVNRFTRRMGTNQKNQEAGATYKRTNGDENPRANFH